jgi:glycosyltransferase involved in cell wall biosynthesis
VSGGRSAQPLKILFISHSAGRTGAPLILLHLARWLRANTDVRCAFVVRGTGEFLADFGALGPTAVLPTHGAPWRLLGKRIVGQVVVGRYVLPLARRLGGVDLIYSNTLTNGRVLNALSGLLRRPVVSHVHELEFASRFFTRPDDLQKTLLTTDQYIACSNAVSDFLREKHAVGGERISVVHDFIPARTISRRRGAAGAELRRHLGIPAAALVAGAAGTTDVWKGPDIFVEAARRILSTRADSNVRFVWVGGSGAQLELFRNDVRKAGLSDKVTFVGERLDAPDCFDAFDVFVLPSREDPFPLVVLESAALAKPTVCFLGNGGAAEFVESDAGICVPSGNVEALAEAVETLLRDEARRRSLGIRARDKVLERHDVDIAVPQILSVIYSAVRNVSRGGRATRGSRVGGCLTL